MKSTWLFAVLAVPMVAKAQQLIAVPNGQPCPPGYAYYTEAGPQNICQHEPTPAGIPSTYVATPIGYLNPACVGTTGSLATSCAYPYYLNSGLQSAWEAGGAKTPSNALTVAAVTMASGWLRAAASIVAPPSKITNLTEVPTPPAVCPAGPIYLFPGLLTQYSTSSGTTAGRIIQPVLAYHCAPATGIGNWYMEPWACDHSGGDCNRGPSIVTHPGDDVQEVVQGENCNAQTNECAGFDITMLDLTTGAYTYYMTVPNSLQGEYLVQVVGDALEVYGISSCDNLPPADINQVWEIEVYGVGNGFTVGPRLQNSWYAFGYAPQPASCDANMFWTSENDGTDLVQINWTTSP